MKKKYEAPELEIIPLVLSDVLNGSEHLASEQYGTESPDDPTPIEIGGF